MARDGRQRVGISQHREIPAFGEFAHDRWALWWTSDTVFAFDAVRPLQHRLDAVPEYAQTVASLSHEAAEDAAAISERLIAEAVADAPPLRDRLRPGVMVEYVRMLALLITSAALVHAVSVLGTAATEQLTVTPALLIVGAIANACVFMRCAGEVPSRFAVTMVSVCACLSTIVTLLGLCGMTVPAASTASALATGVLLAIVVACVVRRRRSARLLWQAERALHHARWKRDRAVQVVVQHADDALRQAWVKLGDSQRELLACSSRVRSEAPSPDIGPPKGSLSGLPGSEAIRQVVAQSTAMSW